MTISDFWTNLRLWLDDSNSATYKWTQQELVNYFIWMLDDIARETSYFKDPITTTITEITLSPGTPDYALSSNIIGIDRVKVAGEYGYLDKTTANDLAIENENWRTLLQVFGTDIAFVEGGASADTITSTTTEFDDEGLCDDDYIVITGSASNDKTVQIGTVAAHTLTLSTSYDLVDEAAGDNICLSVMNSDTPSKYLTDYRTGYITLYPCPNEVGKLLLECTVKESTPLTVATLATYTIPIDSSYHVGLIDGVLSLAFLKSGPSTFNAEKAAMHGGRYKRLLSRIKLDLAELRNTSDSLSPHEGTI